MIDSIVEFAVPAILLSATSYSSPDSLNLDFDGCGFSDWLRHAISVLIGNSVFVNGIEISSFHVQIGPIMINIQTDRKVLHCLFDMFDVILRTQYISDGI